MITLSGLFSFIARPFPTPWTGNAAFYQNTTLPLFDVKGRGVLVRGQLMLQTPNVVTTNTVTQQGYGGLFQGQMISQPLIEQKNGS